jgi:GH15 family glucan-1,4-alpha-glucosidase
MLLRKVLNYYGELGIMGEANHLREPMYKKISDYGIIGNLHSVALIGLDGSIDWLCFPHIDSPSVFGALLDDKKGGSFSISPSDDYDSVAEYLPETNILITKYRTRTGLLQLTDFMPIPFGGEEELEEEQHELYRLVDVINGSISIKCNSGGLRINMERKRVSLSRIFKWYASDFGKTLPERLRFIAPYLYRPEEREFLETHAEKITVDYLDYDWRLNRS